MNQLVVGTKVQQMFGTIASRYDRANTVLSFGIHYLWRRRLCRWLPKGDQLFAVDLCTGTGDLLPALSRRYARVLGIDFCLPMIESGRARWEKLKNVTVAQADALNLPLAPQSVDVVTVAFGVRNFEQLKKGLCEIRRVIKPGGRLIILEFGQPTGFIWSRLFQLYSSVIMPLIGGLLTGNREAYVYLPQTSKQFPCREQLVAILEECGFVDCAYESLTSGVAYLYRAEVL